MNKLSIFILTIVIFIDQVSKACALKFLESEDSINLIDNFLKITCLKNYGAAFGIFENGRIAFIIITMITIFFIFQFMKKQSNKIYRATMLMIIAGGIGNLIDRIFRGYVIDFISLSFFPPVFNLADCFITVGVILIIVQTLISKDEVFLTDFVLKSSNKE